MPDAGLADGPPHHRYRTVFAQTYARYAKVSAARAAELADGLDVTVRDGFVRVTLDYEAVDVPFDGTEDGLRTAIIEGAELLATNR